MGTTRLHVTETHTEAKSVQKRARKSKDIDDIASLEWHSLPAEEVAQRLGVSPAAGLDLEIASRRLSKDGKNIITPPRTNWFTKVRSSRRPSAQINSLTGTRFLHRSSGTFSAALALC